MRANNAEIRRRSGSKQSNTERIARTNRHRPNNGRGENDERFGVKLQRAVSARLRWLGIEHEAYDNDHPVNRAERVELLVRMPWHSRVPAIKLQYTLRQGTKPKIAQFIEAAIRGEDRDVPRVYLEIDAPQTLQLKDLAERVGYAIQKIIRTIRDLPREIGNVIGLTLDVASKNWRDSLTRLPLLERLNRKMLESIASAMRAVQTAKAARSKFTWPSVAYSLLRFAHELLPRPNPSVATQNRLPLRMPFRR